MGFQNIETPMSSLTSTFAQIAGYKAYVHAGCVPAAVAGGGTWAWSQGATHYGGYTSIGNAAGNYVEYTFYAPAGTYSLTVAHVKAGFGGIVTISVDGAAALGTTIDLYAASTTTNQAATITGVTLATSGLHTIRFTCATKHASSGGYYVHISGFSLTRTGA